MRVFLLALSLLFATHPAQAALKVLTSIQPLQLIATELLGEQGTSEVLLPPGASPHSFTLRPSDSRRFAEADAFFWIGPDMENFLIKLAERRPQHSHALQQLDGLELLYYHDHDDDELDSHDHHHPSGGLDAHLWLSSHNARVMAGFMADEFSRLDPQHAGFYQARLEQFSSNLQQLDSELQQLLSPLQNKTFFVFHEAFNYLQHQHGLEHRAVFAINSEVRPGARHVQHMRQLLEQTGPACIFTEPPAPPRLAASLTKGLPVQLQELDPLGSRATSYAALLRNIAVGMQQCLQPLP